MLSKSPYPIIDVFAGPGGLGEGFAATTGDQGVNRFESVLSIEHDEFAHRTLLLRHFLRHFPRGNFPDAYYDYLKEKITLSELYGQHENEFKMAHESALKITLGPKTHEAVRRLILDRLAGKELWALVGGPPCQAYSLAGRSRMMGNPEFEKDERHFLYKEYLRLIIDHRPPVFVMENVKGLLSATVDGKPIISRIVADLTNPKTALGKGIDDLSYRLHSLSHEESPGREADPRLFLVKAEEHGVPQARHRMFIVGIRSDIDVRPRQLMRSEAPTVRQIIGNLPSVRSGLSRKPDTTDNWLREIAHLSTINLHSQSGDLFASSVAGAIQTMINQGDYPEERSSRRYPKGPTGGNPVLEWLYDSHLSTLTGHQSKTHMGSDLRRYMFAAVFAQEVGRSPVLADFPQELLPDHSNVDLGRAGRMFSDRFRVQLSDRVASTITSHISKDGHYFIHYDPMQCRSLTVREAARLQTFPDNYSFEGPQTKQYHQIGNAVPPYLAKQIAEIIGDVLDAIGRGV
jgi:DNA (cytosine-5)-methyltransferase 1